MNIQPTGFETFNRPVVETLLINTASIMEEASGVRSPREYVILHKDDCPMCSNGGDMRIIFLAVKDNCWCQWMYQFAHEYCHHLINGAMNGGLTGLQWFEETLCELASLFCLSKSQNPQLWSQLGCPRYALSVQTYIDSLVHATFPLRQDYYSWNNVDNPLGIRPWLGILGETSTPGKEKYQRNLYSAVASLLLPPFLRMPRLWHIIAHIGDSARWQSLEELLSHLESEMPADCLAGLQELRRILLG